LDAEQVEQQLSAATSLGDILTSTDVMDGTTPRRLLAFCKTHHPHFVEQRRREHANLQREKIQSLPIHMNVIIKSEGTYDLGIIESYDLDHLRIMVRHLDGMVRPYRFEELYKDTLSNRRILGLSKLLNQQMEESTSADVVQTV
jgi:hypothetical protein